MPVAAPPRPVADPTTQSPRQQQQAVNGERVRLPHVSATAAAAAAGADAAPRMPADASSLHAFETAAPDAAGAGTSSSSSRHTKKAAPAARTLRVTLLLCLLVVSAGVVHSLDAMQLQLLIESLHDAPLASMAMFVLLFGAAVVLLVPGMLLTVGSGAAFGLVSGAVVAFLGTLLGQVLAFLLGRYLLRDLAASYLEGRVPRFRAVDAGISEDGWKLVLLLRLSPVLPHNLMNYALGVTAIKLLPYTAASAVAMVPYVALFAWLGSVSTDLYGLLHDGAAAYMTPQLLIGLACIAILSAVGLVFVCRHAMGHLDSGEPGGDGGDEDAADGEGRSLLPTSARDV